MHHLIFKTRPSGSVLGFAENCCRFNQRIDLFNIQLLRWELRYCLNPVKLDRSTHTDNPFIP